MYTLWRQPVTHSGHIVKDFSPCCFLNNNHSWWCRTLYYMSHFFTNTYFHECGLCLSYQDAVSSRAGDSFLLVIEQLEHVQNTHDSRNPVEENMNIRRFFIRSLTLVVSVNEHSERVRFLRESLHARVFKADVSSKIHYI